MRENGFDPDSDAPSDEERAKRILEKLLLAKPDYAAAILPRLGIELELPTAAPEGGAAPEPEVPSEDPAAADGQDRELPDTAGDPPPSATTVPGPGTP